MSRNGSTTKVARVVLLLGVAALFMFASAGPALATEGLTAPRFEYEPYEFVPASDGTPSDTQYRLFDEWGGTWYDAEKSPTNTDDDLMCWAAAAANMQRWTGWGYVPAPEGALGDEDEMFAHYLAHWEDEGSLTYIGLQWWLTGGVPSDYPNDPPYNGGPAAWAEVDVSGGGGFWTGYTWTNYVHYSWSADALQTIDTYLHNGWAVGLGIYDGGHAITCWGVNYDEDESDPYEKYKGVWVTDSDDDKNSSTPPDVLHYYEVDYHDGQWYLQGYGGGGWYIDLVVGLEPFPNTAPVADANGPYTADEGTTIVFDASASTDADANPLQYRWDFDNDGVWDTGWTETASVSHAYPDDYDGYVAVQVTDQMDTDTDVAAVMVTNVAPTVDAGTDQTVDEAAVVAFSGSFFDPGTADTHTFLWDFGDGSTQSGTLTPTHVYGDNGVYPVTLTVTDDDGGMGTDTLFVTVNNVAPEIVSAGFVQPNQEFILPMVHGLTFTAEAVDPGSDDLLVSWDWGDGSPITQMMFYNDGSGPDPYPSPNVNPMDITHTAEHTYALPGDYMVTFTVIDDDGGMATMSIPVHVADVDEALTIFSDYLQSLPDDAFRSNPDKLKVALANFFWALQDMWASQEYQGMISSLNSNIRAKADGLVGGRANDDWIVADLAVQTEICQKVDDLSAYLQYLLDATP